MSPINYEKIRRETGLTPVTPRRTTTRTTTPRTRTAPTRRTPAQSQDKIGRVQQVFSRQFKEGSLFDKTVDFSKVLVRETLSTPFQIVDFVEKQLPGNTSYTNRGRIASNKYFNKVVGLSDETIEERSDFGEFQHSTDQAISSFRRGNLLQGAKHTGAAAFYGAVNVLNFVGIGGGVSAGGKGVARGLKAAKKLKKGETFAKNIEKTNPILAQQRLSGNTERLVLSGKDEFDTFVEQVGKRSDRAIQTKIGEKALKETDKRIAGEAEKIIQEIPKELTGGSVEVLKKIDRPVAIRKINPKADVLNQMRDIDKSKLIMKNSFADAFNTLSKGRTARIIASYDDDVYRAFFKGFKNRLDKVVQGGFRSDQRKFTTAVNILQGELQREFSQFATKTLQASADFKALPLGDQKKLLRGMANTAQSEVKRTIQNAYKIATARRQIVDIDADLIASRYLDKIEKLNEAGASIKTNKKGLIGTIAYRAGRLRSTSAAKTLLQDGIYKNYTKIAGNGLKAYYTNAINKSNALQKFEKTNLIKNLNREISQFTQGKGTVEQLNERLGNYLKREDGTSIINEALDRRLTLEQQAIEQIGKYGDTPLLQRGYNEATEKKLKKDAKEALKEYTKLRDKVGREEAIQSSLYQKVIDTQNQLHDALTLKDFDFKNLRELTPLQRVGRIAVGRYATAAKKALKGDLAGAFLRSTQAEAFNTSQLLKVFTRPDGKVHPLVGDTLMPALRSADTATYKSDNLTKQYLSSLEGEVQTFLNKQKGGVKGRVEGAEQVHSQYFSALLLENLVSSKLDVAKLARTGKYKEKEVSEIAQALTGALKEQSADIDITAEQVENYIKSIDFSSTEKRLASKKKAMHEFRKSIGMSEELEKMFDKKMYPYIQEVGDFYRTKVKDSYTVFYGKEAPTDYDFYFPLYTKGKGGVLDDAGELPFLKNIGSLLKTGSIRDEGITAGTKSLNARNTSVADKVYSLNGLKSYSVSTGKVYRFGHAAPNLYRSAQILKALPQVNKNVREALNAHLSKIVSQEYFEDGLIDGMLRWVAGTRVSVALGTPQFAAGTYTARGVESLVGMNKVAKEYQVAGKQLLEQHKDWSQKIRDAIPERFDEFDTSQADTAMLNAQRNTAGLKIRGNLFKDTSTFVSEALGADKGVGRKVLNMVSKPEEVAYERVMVGKLLERYAKKVKAENPSIPDDAIPSPSSWEELVGDGNALFEIRNQLDDIFGAITAERRSPASVSADGFLTLTTILSSWLTRNKVRLGTAHLRDTVRKGVDKELMEELALTYDDAQSFWGAVEDTIASESSYQIGRIITQDSIAAATGNQKEENTIERMRDSIGQNLAQNALSIGWAGQELSGAFTDAFRGYGVSIFDTAKDAFVSGSNIPEAGLNALTNSTFLGGALLNNSGAFAPLRKLAERLFTQDTSDKYFRKELRNIFIDTPSVKQGIAQSLNFYQKGNNAAVPWTTVKHSSYSDEQSAKEAILNAALQFNFQSGFTKITGLADEDKQLSGIQSDISTVLRGENSVAKNARSIYTLLTMSDDDYRSLDTFAEEVAQGSRKTVHRNRLNSWRRFRDRRDGSINERAVNSYLSALERGVESGLRRARTDEEREVLKKRYGEYEEYVSKVRAMID